MSYIGKQPRKAALTSSDIEDGIITAAKIEDGAVVAAEIASNAVTTVKINADAVTGAKIADDAINSEHYTDGSIDTAHLADGQVTTAKLATAVFTGATDIGADIADADLFLMDDGAGGTIRKTTASRLKTYAGVAGISSSADATAITIDSSENVSLAQNLSFNSGFGSATTVYGLRVWVNFKGSDTFAIRDSGGVSSVTDNGVGSYTVNFSTNMPDSNFVSLTNPGPVISTGAKQFYFTSSSQPDAVGTCTIVSRSVDIDDDGFASADNDYVAFIAIR